MFATAPIAGRLSAKVDPRIMMAIGFSGFAAGTWIVTGITKDWDFYELLWPQVLRGCSLMLCMIPINNIALGTLPPARMKNASGLYNLTRNLGGAVGLALINTALNDRWTCTSPACTSASPGPTRWCWNASTAWPRALRGSPATRTRWR